MEVMRRTASFLAVGILTMGFTACGQQDQSGVAVAADERKPPGADSRDPDPSSVPKRTPPPKSPNLKVGVEPNFGPPGTMMRIEVSGCNDPDGLNHAVSFNNDPENFAVRFDPETVRLIESKQEGERLTAEYMVSERDYTGSVGRVYVQCNDGLATVEFRVTPSR